MYDFKRCKLCGEHTAAPKYHLKKMVLYACSRCDFHYINALDAFPPPRSEATLLTKKDCAYIESKLPQNSAQLKVNLDFVQQHVTLAGAKCLDIGCGAGVFPSLLHTAGAMVSALEPQQVFREFCHKKFQLSVRPELIDEPYWQLEFSDYFDVVTLWDTLEHVNFPSETIKAIAKVIKPGGHLFLDTPSRNSFFYRASEWSYLLSRGKKPMLLNTLYSAKPYCHKQIFTNQQLWQLLEYCGFSTICRSTLHRSKNKSVLVCQKDSLLSN
ncbi:MAG: class I SAM-dependent methyltransferase [Thermodesulfobacteriota bacterium]|nr:class I SAM-dependent methyltransferase [Thermodesulfobacteriota bacterium]